MAATTVNRDTAEMALISTISHLEIPVAAASSLLAGTIGCFNAAGYAVPGTTATGLFAAGCVQALADNSAGGLGAIKAKIKPGVFHFANDGTITIASRGDDCYIVDNQTLAAGDGGGTRSVAGKVVDVDSTGVWVALGLKALV